MTPQETRTKVDARIAAVLPQIEAKADQFLAQQGRYWQAFATHSTPPLDGVDTLPDVGNGAPHDQGDPWPVVVRTRAEPMAVAVHVYEGPTGHGYVAVISVRVTGADGPEEWTRTIQFGPEPGLAHDWELLPPPVFGPL